MTVAWYEDRGGLTNGAPGLGSMLVRDEMSIMSRKISFLPNDMFSVARWALCWVRLILQTEYELLSREAGLARISWLIFSWRREINNTRRVSIECFSGFSSSLFVRSDQSRADFSPSFRLITGFRAFCSTKSRQGVVWSAACFVPTGQNLFKRFSHF